MSSTADVTATLQNAKGADGEEAVPFCGLICCFNACYTIFPQCIGMAGNSSCLCCHSEFISCKLPNPEKEEDKDIWCVCNRGNTVLAPPKNCCSERVQCFCFDARGSLPPTEEIPCLFTVCFFTLFYKSKAVMKFMAPLKDLEAAAAAM